MLIAVINTIGIILTIIGGLLLFRYGIPPMSRHVATYLVVEGNDAEEEEERRQVRRSDRFALAGFLALVLGSVLQIAATWMPTLEEFRSAQKSPSPPVPVAQTSAEPKWRELRVDDESGLLFTPEVQTIGGFKRVWLGSIFKKPASGTVNGSTGLVATRMDLTEIDCAANRVRILQSNFSDEKDWFETETPAKPEWFFVIPDAKNMVVVEHACGRNPVTTGDGFGSIRKAANFYRAVWKPVPAKGDL